jgi:dTDP-4-dehydrorhamnose reductase
MRVLVTGGRGQLGRELAVLLGADGWAPGRDELDIERPDAVLAAIHRFQPDAVIHTAALTDTRRCEDDPELARRMNGFLAGRVAEIAAAAGARFVFISSNEVFDGTKGSPYFEHDEPNPINHYGRSKLAGERAVQDAHPGAQVARVSWLYTFGGNNFPAKILAAARSRPRLSLVTDERAAPTWTRPLAAAILRLVETGEAGTFHLSPSGSCSRYEWAALTLELAGISTPIDETTLAELHPYPPKPPDSTLANTRAAKLGIRLDHWERTFREYAAAGGLNTGTTAD